MRLPFRVTPAEKTEAKHALVLFVGAFAAQIATAGTGPIGWEVLSSAAVAAGVATIRQLVPSASVAEAVTVLLKLVGRSKTQTVPAPPAK